VGQSLFGWCTLLPDRLKDMMGTWVKAGETMTRATRSRSHPNKRSESGDWCAGRLLYRGLQLCSISRLAALPCLLPSTVRRLSLLSCSSLADSPNWPSMRTDKSVGVLGFSLENFLDVITSFLIIWRFGGFSRGPLILGDPVRATLAAKSASCEKLVCCCSLSKSPGTRG